MKKILSFSIFLASFFTLINSCDVIEPPFREEGSIVLDSADKVVLIEEYTGFRCGNCPEAGEIAHQLKEKFPDNIVLLSIHAGALAMPNPQHKYNFVSDAMKDLEKYYNIGWGPGTPNGLVDRTEYFGTLILNHADWESAFLERVKQKSVVKVELSPSYNHSNKTISCEVKLQFSEEVSEQLNIALYVVEDSIVQYQTDYRKEPIDVEDFVHNNILRYSITSTFGEPVSEATIVKGASVNKTYSLQIPSTADWRPEWIRLVAVISKPENDHEVIQAAEKYILK